MTTQQIQWFDIPLSDEEIDRLDDFLCSVGDHAMNVEQLDGFFAALVAGPELVMPSEYWPEVVGEDFEYETIEQAQDILMLTQRLWNTIAVKLHGGDPYLPIMLIAENETVARGCDWAKGFMHGVSMRSGSWQGLLHDERHAGAILPMMMLAHEDDPDPSLRPPPISPDKRENIHISMAAGLMGIYRYFGPLRKEQAMQDEDVQPTTYQRDSEKIGRNDPCPCGSGKKYKKCCLVRDEANVH